MNDRRDLDAALARASEWVRAEMAFVNELTAEFGLVRAVEGGPRAVYSTAGRTVLHAHPKRAHVGIGLPDAMRSDVAALTDALRQQKGLAWFNYLPGVVDRDTIALLLQTSVDRATDRTQGSADRGRPTSPLRDDEADLQLVLTAIRAFKTHENTTGRPSTLKPLREVVFFCWEGPGSRQEARAQDSFCTPRTRASFAASTAPKVWSMSTWPRLPAFSGPC